MREARIWFVNRFFYPDHSATSQILPDLALHLAQQGRKIGVIASRGIYEDASVVLPAFEEYEGIAVHRVSRLASREAICWAVRATMSVCMPLSRLLPLGWRSGAIASRQDRSASSFGGNRACCQGKAPETDQLAGGSIS
jgi:hypothetical protein